jgi:hypothetical protein
MTDHDIAKRWQELIANEERCKAAIRSLEKGAREFLDPKNGDTGQIAIDKRWLSTWTNERLIAVVKSLLVDVENERGELIGNVTKQ